MAFRIAEAERDGLRALRDEDVSQDIESSNRLAQGKPFETEKWSTTHVLSGRAGVASGFGRLVSRFTNPRVGIPPSSKK